MKTLFPGWQEPKKRVVINKLNDLKSQEWLIFQKSWFIHDENKLFEDFISFFTKQKRDDGSRSLVISAFLSQKKIKTACDKLNRRYLDISKNDICELSDYCLIDLRNNIHDYKNLGIFLKNNDSLFEKILKYLNDEKYFTLFIDNVVQKDVMYPFAWDLARNLAKKFCLKDEKIGCIADKHGGSRSVFYSLNFRKSKNKSLLLEIPYTARKTIEPIKKSASLANALRGSWIVPKPPPREKDVLLHPAKFPETLVKEFIDAFTDKGDTVLDPMVGTGSVLVACLESSRFGYGIELNKKYAMIARKRIDKIQSPEQSSFIDSQINTKCEVIHGDASRINEYKTVPKAIDYCITSPPYWDMLRMKGAMTQKMRTEKGLDVTYSDDKRDVGNITDYEQFLLTLGDIYFKIYDILKSHSFLTIIVKNIKKSGAIYPLAWDLVNLLSKKYIFFGETLWCQNDINLAPYGYGNAWVSNTFHHYCLHFEKYDE